MRYLELFIFRSSSHSRGATHTPHIYYHCKGVKSSQSCEKIRSTTKKGKKRRRPSIVPVPVPTHHTYEKSDPLQRSKSQKNTVQSPQAATAIPSKIQRAQFTLIPESKCARTSDSHTSKSLTRIISHHMIDRREQIERDIPVYLNVSHEINYGATIRLPLSFLNQHVLSLSVGTLIM